MITGEPHLTVGVIQHARRIRGELKGRFDCLGKLLGPGSFETTLEGDGLTLRAAGSAVRGTGPTLSLTPSGKASFMLRDVIIGVQFHWERREDQTFEGTLRLVATADGITAINQVPLELYLKSVISSEMSASCPQQLLRAHAITSRSWLAAMLERRGGPVTTPPQPSETEIVRWYTREDHDLFDVCADDHCQRYQGTTKIISSAVDEAVDATRGLFLTYGDTVCDARFYKACGGLTEEFHNAWEDVHIPYLKSVADSATRHPAIRSELEARTWCLSSPEAYCNTRDPAILRQILPGFDQETTDFFRWQVRYRREELEEILRARSGLDFGTIADLVPLARGPSGRIYRLKIVGSRRTMVVGKELEIRRWLSRSHLYSSAFVVDAERDPSGTATHFILNGAGWGHGVGLCQIGAAVMAVKGFPAEQIVQHYFPGASLTRLYV